MANVPIRFLRLKLSYGCTVYGVLCQLVINDVIVNTLVSSNVRLVFTVYCVDRRTEIDRECSYGFHFLTILF